MGTSLGIPQLAALIVGAFSALLIAAVLVVNFRAVRFVAGAMFFVSSIGVAREWNDDIVYQWLYPVQNYRSYIYIGLGGLAWVAVLANMPRMSLRSVPAQGVVLLVMAAYAAFLQMVHETAAEGAMSYVFAGMTMLPLLLALPAFIESEGDCYGLMRMLVVTFWVWLGAVCVQVVIGFDRIVVGMDQRFTGLTSNPQHAAALAAFIAIISVALVVVEQKRLLKLMFGATCAICLVLLLWAGSRTGLGMAAIGITIVLARRIGYAALLLPLGGIVMVIGLEIVKAVGAANVQRLASTQNTRAEPWAKLLASAAESPFIGVGMRELGEAQATENSYLLAAASYGVVMFALVLLFVLVSIFVVVRLYRLSRFTEIRTRGLIDVTAAVNAAYFAGAVLEGYIMGRVGAPLFIMLVFSAIAVRLRQIVGVAQIDEATETEYESAGGVPPRLAVD